MIVTMAERFIKLQDECSVTKKTWSSNWIAEEIDPEYDIEWVPGWRDNEIAVYTFADGSKVKELEEYGKCALYSNE